MKINRVRIENFRSLLKVDIPFDEITCFVGPTGAGKSTVLRALDWFFNGEKSVALDDEDLHSAGQSPRITVEVEFGCLTAEDHAALGSYAPPEADTVIIWRTWEGGDDKISGKGRAYPPFEEVRRHTAAMDKRRAYNALRDQRPDLGLPTAGSAAAVDDAMRTWETQHRDQLTETEIDGTHFFGFAGQSKLAELIDFVFISADLRAYEEADDRKMSAVGRILDHALDRSEAGQQIGMLEENIQRERLEIHEKVYGPALDDIADALSREVSAFTAGRKVRVTPVAQAPKPARTTFRVSVQDGAAETSVYRQGHGFQRALIIGALKLLAEYRRPDGSSRTLCLAIEEPELFQHPTQARTFADVLRELASSPDGRLQVMYATHNPVFIDPRGFHEIRRLSRDFVDGHPATQARWVTESDLCESLDSYVSERQIRSRAGISCTDTLAEAVFAEVALLTEGDTDGGVIVGCAQRQKINLGTCRVCVVHAGGKGNIILCHAILTALGVPCYVVFDGDEGSGNRSVQG